ncbi:putative fork head domain-containing protein FD5 [Penaeus vannamei]|uniref:Putative fork head domain-containing protein FD5 n=1 Tax=Penaeus vannamei TaxID=6689 RepID=A0A3R7M3E6_PENVA|nr:putative fork head domain-containing protein FD5 [Penaeus vannamei]
MPPRPESPAMESVCGREPSVSPPTVVAPVAVKPALSDAHAVAAPTDQQRLLYQLALAERLRLASAGLAWARPPLTAHHPHLQDTGVGGMISNNFMGSLGMPVIGGLGSVAFGGPVVSGAAGQLPPYASPHPLYGYRLVDPRMLLPRGPEEPKPQHSYIGLIAMAILSSPDKKLVLSDIYQYILDHYPYFRSRGTGWRNSIRHNLSLNDCFVKAGRSANGKGHYWAIHPANIDDFRRGDFRRRRAQRRVRKHLGLAVDDDSEPEAVSPPPPHGPTPDGLPPSASPRAPATDVPLTRPKRQFDVLSLLAPDRPRPLPPPDAHHDDPLMDSAHERHLEMPDDRLPLGEGLRLKAAEETPLAQVEAQGHFLRAAAQCLRLPEGPPRPGRPLDEGHVPSLLDNDGLKARPVEDPFLQDDEVLTASEEHRLQEEENQGAVPVCVVRHVDSPSSEQGGRAAGAPLARVAAERAVGAGDTNIVKHAHTNTVPSHAHTCARVALPSSLESDP